MAKVVVCDVCRKEITDPHESNLTQFTYEIDYRYEGGMILPDKIKRKTKQKVDLCGECFENLRKIAEGKNE